MNMMKNLRFMTMLLKTTFRSFFVIYFQGSEFSWFGLVWFGLVWFRFAKYSKPILIGNSLLDFRCYLRVASLSLTPL